MQLILLFLLFTTISANFFQGFRDNGLVPKWRCKLRPGLCPLISNKNGYRIHQYEAPFDLKNVDPRSEWGQFLCKEKASIKKRSLVGRFYILCPIIYPNADKSWKNNKIIDHK